MNGLSARGRTVGCAGILVLLLCSLLGSVAAPPAAASTAALPPPGPIPAGVASTLPVHSIANPLVHPAGPGSSIVDGATILGEATVMSQPSTATYDSDDNDLYVTNFGAPLLGGNTVSIVADRNDTVLATVPVGDDPLFSVYAPSTGNVYVLNFGTSNNLTVLHGLKIIKWIPTGGTPVSALYDPDNQWVYVTNQATGNLTVINGTTTVGSVPTGSYPGLAAFDNQTGWVYVPNTGTNNVTIVNGTAGSGTATVATVNVGSGPTSAIYDSGNGWTYIANPGSNNVTVLNRTSVVASVPAGGAPSFGAYDPQDGFVYVADGSSNSVSILNGTSVVGNVSVGVFPQTAAYDPADGLIYVANWGSDTVSVFNGTTVVATIGVGINPRAFGYDPHVRSIYDLNFNSNNLSQIGTPSPAYPVTFAETGLPGGTNWTVQLNSTEYPTNGTQIGFPEANGTYNYTISTVPGFSAVVSSAQVTVTGGPIVVNVTFESAYPVTFHQSGLAPETFWSVGIRPVTNGTLNATLELWEPNGTYTYLVTPVAGYETTWNGSVTVAGAAREVNLTFVVTTYPVTFQETGLPNGTLWGSTLGPYEANSTNASFAIEAPNGTYDYALAPVAGLAGSPPLGRVSVTGQAVVVRVAFVPAYPVEFVETGLPAGTNWTTTLGTGPVTTNASSVSVARPNGSYSFSVSTPVFQYIPSTPHGSFNVSGAAVVVNVTFVPRSSVGGAFWLHFDETGLPGGTIWNVTLGNTTNSSTTPSIGFLVTNASYPFFDAAAGYLGDPSAGVVVANGAASVATPIPIAFTRTPSPKVTFYPVTFTSAGLPASEAWQVAIGSNVSSGVTTSLLLSEPNGTYSYAVDPVPGFVANLTGSATVAGGPVLVVVDFHPFLTTVVFRETGLTTGVGWNVTLGSVVNSSTGSLVDFAVPNGTYSFTVGGGGGSAPPGGGTVVVNGTGPTIVELRFGSAGSGAGTVFGLSPLEAVGVAVLVAVVLVVVGTLTPTGSSSTPESEPGTARRSAEEDEPTPRDEPTPPSGS
ncbi:MAG: YncE family protein [Thermoplasmata archaeon]|nr:YncE family protein [Thermoplasmata archaeon]